METIRKMVTLSRPPKKEIGQKPSVDAATLLSRIEIRKKVGEFFLSLKKEGNPNLLIVQSRESIQISTRRICISSIRKMKNPKEAICLFLKIAKDRKEDESMRIEAIKILSKIGDSKVARGMSKLLTSKNPIEIRKAAVEAIPRIARRRKIDYNEIMILDNVSNDRNLPKEIANTAKKARYSIKGSDIKMVVPKR